MSIISHAHFHIRIYKKGVNSCTPEGGAVSVPLKAPIIIPSTYLILEYNRYRTLLMFKKNLLEQQNNKILGQQLKMGLP